MLDRKWLLIQTVSSVYFWINFFYLIKRKNYVDLQSRKPWGYTSFQNLILILKIAAARVIRGVIISPEFTKKKFVAKRKHDECSSSKANRKISNKKSNIVYNPINSPINNPVRSPIQAKKIKKKLHEDHALVKSSNQINLWER